MATSNGMFFKIFIPVTVTVVLSLIVAAFGYGALSIKVEHSEIADKRQDEEIKTVLIQQGVMTEKLSNIDKGVKRIEDKLK